MSALLFQLVARDGVTFFEFSLSRFFDEVKLLAEGVLSNELPSEAKQEGVFSSSSSSPFPSSSSSSPSSSSGMRQHKYYLVEAPDNANIVLRDGLPGPGVRNYTAEILAVEAMMNHRAKLYTALIMEKNAFYQREKLEQGRDGPSIIEQLDDYFSALKVFTLTEAEQSLFRDVITAASDTPIREKLSQLPGRLQQQLRVISALPPAEFAIHFEGEKVILEIIDEDAE